MRPPASFYGPVTPNLRPRSDGWLLRIATPSRSGAVNESLPPLIAIAALAALTGACAPVIGGGPPTSLAPSLAESAGIGTITLSTEWLRANDDIADTFSDEVREELDQCATGSYPLNLRVQIDAIRREGRIAMALYGEGFHGLAATAELVDPARGNEIVGRFPIMVETSAGGRVEGLLGDRQMMVSEAWARSLCTEAFGHNPRRSGLHNATRD